MAIDLDFSHIGDFSHFNSSGAVDYSQDPGHGSNLSRSERAVAQWNRMSQQQRTAVRKKLEKTGEWKGGKRAQKTQPRAGAS